MSKGFLRALLCVVCLWPVAMRASGSDCATQTWLAQTHHLAQVMAQARHGPQATQVAQQLLSALEQYPIADLAPRLRAAGLSAHTGDIAGFLKSQKTLAESQILFGGTAGYPARQEQNLTAFARRMQKLAPSMRCDEDPSWRPPTTLAATGRSVPVALSGGTQTSLFFPPNWPALSLIGCGLAAALAGLSILLRRHAQRQRRREQRFSCALSCRLEAPPHNWPGRICDISQRGAKICLGTPVPDDITHCSLSSHGRHMQGRIVWRNAQCLGLAFRRPLPEREVHMLIAQGRVRAPPNA